MVADDLKRLDEMLEPEVNENELVYTQNYHDQLEDGLLTKS